MDQYIQAIVALLAIANPLSAVPVFLQAVDGVDKTQRRKSASLAAVSVFAILLVAAVAGNWVLDIFGISISAFRCGGGLVILLMGLTMLQGRTSRVQKESLTHNERQSKIFVPIAMPLVAGPGAITTVITIALAEPYWKNLSVALTAIVILALVLWVVLLLSQGVQGLLGPLGQKLLLRFFGLILVAIGMQFILAGAHEFFHQRDGIGFADVSKNRRLDTPSVTSGKSSCLNHLKRTVGSFSTPDHMALLSSITFDWKPRSCQSQPTGRCY